MTDREHAEAGVVVVAPSLERARELAASASDFPEDHRTGRSGYRVRPLGLLTAEPDVMRHGVDGPEGVWVFPDAGCC